MNTNIIYDFIINSFNYNTISKFTEKEIKEEIQSTLSTSSSHFNPDIIAQEVIRSLQYKQKFNELSSDYDLLNKDTFLSSVAIELLQANKLLDIYDEDFSKLKSKYKEKYSLLKHENQELKHTLQTTPSIPFSQDEIFNLAYPDLNNIPLPEEYHSRESNILCNINNLNLNAALLSIEHYPLSAYTKNPVSAPSSINNKLYPYGLPELREADPSTNLPLNFNPSSEVYLIGLSLHNFKLKPNKLSCLRIRNDNNCCYDSTDWIEESLPRCEDTILYLTQPNWETFQDGYDYTINFIIHFIVFKAKPNLPSEFMEYWSKQSDLDMFNDYDYFKSGNPAHLTKTLDVRYPIMKLFYSSYLMNEYLNLTEDVLKNLLTPTSTLSPISTQNTTPIKSIATLKPGDLVYVNRYNFGIIIGEKEIFLDNNLTIIEDNDKFCFSDSSDHYIIPELLLFSESILDQHLLNIKHNIIIQYKLLQLNKIKHNKLTE